MSDTPKVADFAAERAARTPHMQGEARCLACGHEERVVAPEGTTEMECAACHLWKSVWVGMILPSDGEDLWQCFCGGQYFVLTATAPQCVKCGREQVGWEPQS